MLGGGKQATAEQTISKTSGLDAGAQAANLLAMAAPLIMGFLGRQKKQQGFDAGQLASMLGGARDDMVKKQPDAMSALAGLLDSDGDGSVMDDVASASAPAFSAASSRAAEGVTRVTVSQDRPIPRPAGQLLACSHVAGAHEVWYTTGIRNRPGPLGTASPPIGHRAGDERGG